MKPFNAYIYPNSSRSPQITNNPYLDYFMDSLSSQVNFLNQDYPSAIGILDLVKYVKKLDYLFLNWIEDLPDKKQGLIQTLFFLTVLRFKKLLGIKVIWTLHNKISHHPQHLFWKRMLFRHLLHRSDLILTHARAGIDFAEQMEPGVSSRMFCFPHPIVPSQHSSLGLQKVYDILIWGSIAPYKGIHVFLEALKQRGRFSKYRILVVGKASSSAYLEELLPYGSAEIEIRNTFVEPEELSLFIGQSRMILFTYSGGSVLSSGALIDSIAHKARVVGPDVGAFQELGALGIIDTYQSMDDLLDRLDQMIQDPNVIPESRVAEFIEAHSWEKYGIAVMRELPSVK